MQERSVFKVIDNNTIDLFLKIRAGAKKNAIIGSCEEFGKHYLCINIDQQAIDGKANKKLVTFLAKTLKIRKTDITLKKGEKSSYKIVRLNCAKDLSILILSIQQNLQ